MPTSCIDDATKQLKMGSVFKVVWSDVFSSAVQQRLRAVLREFGIHHTTWREKLYSSLKHDAIPTICPAIVGSRRRYLKDVTNLSACSLLHDRSSVRIHHTDKVFRRNVGARLHIKFLFKYRASIDVTNSALSGLLLKCVNKMETNCSLIVFMYIPIIKTKALLRQNTTSRWLSLYYGLFKSKFRKQTIKDNSLKYVSQYCHSCWI